MHIPSYISPSQASLFYTDRAEYYMRYLADNRVPRLPQTDAMALGGAFDSHLKRALAKRYLASSDARLMEGGEYDLPTMLSHAIEDYLDYDKLAGLGLALFNQYVTSGAWDRLVVDMDRMDAGSLCMEQAVYYTCPETGMKLMGKPDISFSVGGVGHVYDAKVNGFFSKSGASPLKNHIWNSRDGVAHKDVILQRHLCGTLVDVSGFFSPEYVRQISTYSWALFGRDHLVIGGIEQLACKKLTGSERRPPSSIVEGVGIVYASTRALVSADVQTLLFNEYLAMHKLIQSGWIFDDVSRAESDARCAELESRSLAISSDPEWANMMGRS